MSIGPGTRLGQYEVQDFIGQGAMGVVYRAYHSQLERTGAVKVLQAMTPDGDTVARFRHEAQAIAKLRHPNIVDVYDFGEYEGTPYMIVEYIPGGSLASRMAESSLDRQTALKYLRGIASGLDYAHSRGIVHRDIKPANVLLGADDTPVLADFGLAKLMQGSSLKSMTGMTTGTPAYMAPEQVTGSRVGPAADRYSLATIAYEMLTGVIPFDGEGLMELLYAQVHREPLPPSARDDSLGRRVDAVILRGLAKDPAARWDTASAFVEALASAMGPEPVVGATMVMAPVVAVAAPVAATAPVAETAPQTELEERATHPSRQILTLAYPSPPPPAPPPGKSHKLRNVLIALALVVVLLVAATAGYAATHPPVTFALSATTVTAGDTVVLTADHMPANQVGHVELWSAQYIYDFKADASGHAEVTFTVPVDINAGDHQVKLCWDSSCKLTQTLHVMAPVAVASPSPSPLASASPTSSPSASPSSCLPTIFVSGISKRDGFPVTFKCFPATTWQVSVVQLGTPYGAGSATIPAGSSLYTTPRFKTPTAVRAAVKAYVIVCSSRCFESNSVTVSA